MDLVASYQDKLVDFRIKELKDVLSRAGISKQGKKQDLMDRILALLYDEGTPGLLKNLVNGKEGVMEIIDDVHRKMLESGVNDLTLKKQNSSGTSRVQLKEEDEGSFHLDMKIRCICGDASSSELLIQCEDPNCRVWQHVHCAIISEKPEDIPLPTQFFCEVCRVNRADPFWETLAHPLHPVMLAVSSIPADGANPLRSVKKSFQLTRADRDLLKRAEYDVQAWCMLLNDNVPFRMQWPQYADLQVNGMPVQTVNRPGSQLLGPNGRDDGARISLFILEGGNKVTLSGCDARCFCFGIRLVKRRTLQQVLCMIPKKSDGDSFEDALARVQHCIGGASTAKEDSDSDLEVIADSITVNVRCPMSGSRMKTAGRFKACAHMGCFDLETFVKLNERSRKWQCPICLKNFCIEDIVIDPYFNGIVTLMQKAGEEMTEIDVKPNGCWRVKNADEFKDLATWHHPDGTEITSSSESSKLDENENASREYSSKLHIQSHSTNEKIGELHNRCHFYNNIPNDQSEEFDQRLIKMSSTISGDARDDEDTGIKKDGAELTDILNNDENEINSVLHNYGPIHIMVDQSSSAPAVNIDLIVLSDSEEDGVSFVYPKSVSTDFPCDELPVSCQTPNSCDVDFVGRFSVLTGNGNDILMPQFPKASSSNAVSGSHFLGIDTKVSDIVIDLEQTSVTCSGPSSSCSLPSEFTMNPGSQVLNSHVYLYNAGPVNGLGGNNFGSGDDNISLRGFFPSQSALGNQLQVLSSIHGEDWGCCSSNNEARAESPKANGADLGLQFKSKEASLLPNMDGESGPVPAVSWKRKEGPFSFPRRTRSARRRPNL